jgi:ribonuclease-3
MPIYFNTFEEAIGLHFKNKKLLEQAFTHRSFINEHKRLKIEHNERLEFLGDAVLELITTEYLYEKYPDRTEGDLTSYRSALVNANTLSEISSKLGIEKYLLLSKGESKDTGRARQYILANTFEALVGAIFLDQGYDVARHFISENLFPLTEAIVKEKLWLDAKSHFQEKAQEKASVTPSYRTISEVGPDHDKYFTVAVFLGDKLIAEGGGQSKQDAEQSAARNGLEKKGWM